MYIRLYMSLRISSLPTPFASNQNIFILNFFNEEKFSELYKKKKKQQQNNTSIILRFPLVLEQKYNNNNVLHSQLRLTAKSFAKMFTTFHANTFQWILKRDFSALCTFPYSCKNKNEMAEIV